MIVEDVNTWSREGKSTAVHRQRKRSEVMVEKHYIFDWFIAPA